MTEEWVYYLFISFSKTQKITYISWGFSSLDFELYELGSKILGFLPEAVFIKSPHWALYNSTI